MAANTSPIWSLSPRVSWATAITAANTAMDGTGTVTAAFTAGANGSFISHIQFKAAGTNVATVARIFINNGSTNTTASNNALIAEVTLAATTATNTASLPDYLVPLRYAIPASYVINVVLGTAVSAGWIPVVVGGDY